MQRIVSTCAIVALCGSAFAGPYDPPAGEYTTIESVIASSTPATLGANLRSALRTLTNNAGFISYQNGRFRYDESDLDLDTPGNIILVYNGASVDGTWDSGNTFNREHTWPRSHMANQSSGSLEYTDFHQLRPCNPSINSSRGNEPFGVGVSTLWDPGAGSFDDQDRGEMARNMFYFATRHNNTLVECTNQNQLSDGQMGDRSTLLEWHYEYIADERELYRNDYVDDAIQFNRNPFVDRNEYVWAIFGTGPNDSQITLDGETPVNGATSMSIDFGDVIVGESFPTLAADFTKTGTTPTTYRIFTTGDAVNDLTDITMTPARSGGTFRMTTTTDDWRGRALAFPYGPSSHAGMITGIELLQNNAPGALSGTITIDNTDLTSAGTGMGNDDGDDVITLTGREVEHSNASFMDDSDENFLMLDFGTVQAGDMPTLPVTIYNLQDVSGFTAGLDVTSVSAAGDTGAFSSGMIGTITNVPGAGSATENVQLIAPTAGTYAVTYTINVADTSIPGATANTSLFLVLTAQVEETAIICVGDFDGDGDVDLGDFGVFGSAFNSVMGDANYNAEADFDNDGDVDLGDFGVFGGEFGVTTCAI